MKNETYSEMVARLKKPGADILKDMDSFKANLVHMVLGVVGEYGEVNEAYIAWCTHHENSIIKCTLAAKLVKEMGDLEFYLEGLSQTIRYDSCDFYNHIPRGKGVDNLAEITKKHIATNKPINKFEIAAEIELIRYTMSGYRSELSVSYEDVLRVNMNKLNERYENGQYSDKQAIERADEDE